MNEGYPIPLSPEALMARAREITGIGLVDEDIIEPLARLHRSYCEEACLYEHAAEHIQQYLLRFLCNRLRMKRDFLAHPEIADEVILAPVIICGMPRTGSTKMQKLLAASGDFNWLPFWQALNPSLYTGHRDESSQPRIQDTDNYVNWLNTHAKEAQMMHEYATQEPEEEIYIMMHCLRGPVLGSPALDSYNQWLGGQDNSQITIEFLRDSLKYLQWQGLAERGKRWLLKAPNHYGTEHWLKKYFPDLTLVMTHRHPKELISSLCSFLLACHKPLSGKLPDPSLFAFAVSYQINQHIDNRQQIPDLPILDVYYREVVDSVEIIARTVYEFIGAELTEQALQWMLDWDKSNPIHARGKYKHSTEDFNLTDEQIDHVFANYITLFHERFGEAA